MRFKFEHIVILILVAVIIFLTKCEGECVKECNHEPSTTDTIHRVDTAWFERPEINKDLNPKLASVDTIYIDSSLIVSRAYESDITDTLIEGNIETVVAGELISQKLTYTPLFPKYITKTNEITKYIDNTPKVTPYVSLYAGTNAKLGIGGGLLMEKGYGLNYLYSNKVHYLGLSYRIK